MKKPSIQSLISNLSKLSIEELLILKREVQRQENNQAIDALWESRNQSVKACPHCSDSKIVKNGMKEGRQRFLCRGCGKTFNALTATPLSRLRYAEKHLQYTESMLEGLSIRKAAKKLGVSIPTAFLWRHRFLINLESVQPEKLNGIVEADETYFRKSYKGQRKGIPRKSYHRGTAASLRGLSHEQVPVLMARERTTKATLTHILPKRNAVELAHVLRPVLASDAMVCSDGAKIYKVMGKAHGITVRSSKQSRSGPYHIQNVNAGTSRLKNWIEGNFKGVATKYLPNYLGWLRWMEAQQHPTAAELWRASAG
jgi:transposase-like protein